MQEPEDTQLKIDIDDIMKRVNTIMEKVDTQDPGKTPLERPTSNIEQRMSNGKN